ncbi:MAG: DUF4139 domain-containing protein [Flavobacteriales bacterium]|nr:DUF4139 domain-containing protein [Flavobacteriales bacterium]
MKHLLILLAFVTNTIHAQNSPTSVVLYNSAAEITYTEKMNLNTGKNEIIFRNITPFMVENTLKISCNDKNVEILSVTEKINFIAKTKNKKIKTSKIQNQITTLKKEKGLTNCRIIALSTEKDLLFHDESIGGLSYGVSVDEIENASNFFRKRYTNIVSTIYLLTDSLSHMKKQLSRLQNQLKQAQVNVEKPTSEIHMIVKSNTGSTVEFSYSFLTQKAGWAPLYDVKYQGNSDPVLFNFKANVFNATGIHWKNVTIKLSTATPIKGFAIPSLSDKTEKQNNIESTKGVEFKTLEVVNAITSYDVKHKYSVLSNSKPHLIEVDNYTFDATFEYLIFPRLDPFGFLMAKIPNWNKHNLIPGTTNIYNAGVYMGKTFLNTYAENDTLEIYLGKDKNIQVKRVEDFKNNSRKIVGNYSVEKYKVNIELVNHSTETFSVKIMDQVPIIDNSNKTKMSVNSGNSTYDKQEGLLTWNLQVAPGGKQSMDFKYEIKEPKEYNARPKRRMYRTINCPSF